MPDGKLRIAVCAPPWIPVPPVDYGGVELVVHLLTRGLRMRGHEVALFCAPGSDGSYAELCTPLAAPHGDEIGQSVFEATHVGTAFDVVDRARNNGVPFDVFHDHTWIGLAMANRLATPVVHTLHGIFDDRCKELYLQHGHKATLVSISEDQRSSAPEGVGIGAVIHNPVDVDAWPFERTKDNFLLWIGRICKDKGPHWAIDVAEATGMPLILAGPVHDEPFFREFVKPRLGGEIRWVGPVGGPTKEDLFKRARAVLMPITWREPFGIVMAEALAAGTPVIAFRMGAAPEIVEDGNTGFIVDDVREMITRVGELYRIDPDACRRAAWRFAPGRIAAAYEKVYEQAIAAYRGGFPS
jgi:glycosyltransferase involved in cell wall biosynthesis